MTIKVLFIQQEDLEIELTRDLGLRVRDLKKDCEIDISPEITAMLFSYANVIIRGFMESQKDGTISDETFPDWK
ncbi:hypothetical protein LCGC14_1198500 [marine sediment metagenome]|uniref:Uncharacterized protein n=1 Tax=marine sediment metagenome TaxID=412755 RepID=A0A0F9LHM9_9ZZZZ